MSSSLLIAVSRFAIMFWSPVSETSQSSPMSMRMLKKWNKVEIRFIDFLTALNSERVSYTCFFVASPRFRLSFIWFIMLCITIYAFSFPVYVEFFALYIESSVFLLVSSSDSISALSILRYYQTSYYYS